MSRSRRNRRKQTNKKMGKRGRKERRQVRKKKWDMVGRELRRDKGKNIEENWRKRDGPTTCYGS